MSGQYLHPEWTPSVSLYPATMSLAAVVYALLMLAYPPSSPLRRKLSMIPLAVPTWLAFRHSKDMAPSYEMVDTFTRFCLIWFAHMSYEVCVLEFAPVVRRGKGEMRERFRQAHKVLFDRNHAQVWGEDKGGSVFLTASMLTSTSNAAAAAVHQTLPATNKKTDEPVIHGCCRTQRGHDQHGYSRWRFVRYHVLKALTMYALQVVYDVYETQYSPLRRNPSAFVHADNMQFFRRLPASLHYKELYYRSEEAFEWNIVTMWLYEGYHSVFAVLWVGSGLDAADEWSLSLFGPLADAWSVRRYWNRYWHNYVYFSLSGHFKCVTRGWLGMKRGAVGTRLVENTLVFSASGLMHSLVRWQHAAQGDIWAITFLYLGQMIPIVVEDVVVHYWRRAKRSLGFRDDAKWLSTAEYAVGYSWSIAWQVYSVSKYYITRRVWTDAIIEKRYAALLSDTCLNDT